MAKAPKLLFHLALLFCAAVCFVLDVDVAHAQSRNCASLSRTLASIERNGDFRSLGSNDLRQLERNVQQLESKYVRDGCNAAAKAGERLTSSCRAQARSIINARESLEKAQGQAQSGNAIAQQREAVLQEMARFNCNSRSSGSVTQERRGNLFEQLFGAFEENFSDGLDTRGDDFAGYAGYNTVRTVCVRKIDGYFWPISYSTLVDYAPNDLTQCQEQCPGMDVDLYYYSNPGQEPEQMVNLNGEAYTNLPTAFAYRTAYDRANSCKTKAVYGGITLEAQADGSNRAFITYAEATFPLPIRDPRRQAQVTIVQATATTTFVDVPLPRPRPAAPGEEPKPVAVQQAANAPSRIVMFGDKRVRVVGPDTPYAPTAATGT
ncbi:MAG: DUF2865 domain-containing protein [Hyphomicrobiales bacterium]|nr:MAG: DUF2865 domain-containing protein [Hyphomicrobiales bacterium]